MTYCIKCGRKKAYKDGMFCLECGQEQFNRFKHEYESFVKEEE